jgi:hypothetical protein
MATKTTDPIWKYADWRGGDGEFLKAMHCGLPFECDAEMYDYWLGVLPPVYLPNPVKLCNGELAQADFGFAEGIEPVTVFWQENGRYFGCRTNIMNPNW